MSDEQDKLKLNLEPPKLFGRKKKSAQPAEVRAPEPVAPTAEPIEPEPVDEPQPVVEPEPEPAPEPAPQPVVEPEPEPTAVLPQQPIEPEPEPAPQLIPVSPEPVDEAAWEDAEIATLSDGGPLLTAYRAAAVTGLVVGAAMVVLTWLSLRGCEAVRGTSSCGGGPGFILLVATFALSVLIGAQLLKVFSIPDPGSSSFLAVGLVAVVALLFLIDLLDHWSSLIVVPIISIAGFLASVWVTKTFVDPAEE